MGIEQKNINEAMDTKETEEPYLGKRKTDNGLPYEKLEMKFAVGCLQDDEFRLFANNLMTNSMRHQGTLTQPGDILMIDQKECFDKEGSCHLMLKYLEYVEEKNDAKN